MPRRSCDGPGLLIAFRSAVGALEANVDEVNSLNVFPVPDGDTGTNMLATVKAALAEAEKAANEPAERVAHAASFGALMGARGNSGVIASQILAGLAHGLAGKRRFNGLDLAHALDAGARTAYKAVAKPVEGTILTVIREAAAAAVVAAEEDNNVVTVLAATVEAAERSVARTPSLLPILREAHVVDAGGQGLLRLFQGALAAARGGAVGETVPGPMAGRPATALPGEGETAYGYETVFLLAAPTGRELDLVAIRTHLEALGDSVLVAGDHRIAKIHVHNDRPDAVIAYGLSLGALSRITVENLDGQAHEVRESRAAAFVGVSRGTDTGSTPAGQRTRASAVPRTPTVGLVPGGSAAAARADTSVWAPAGVPGTTDAVRSGVDAVATRLPLGVVAVAPSDGLAAVLADVAAPFREYGVFRVVRGGQGANPSTGELLAAVEATPADELLILPNNPNVVLAARQVATMTNRPVVVIPTRNCAEGVAALLGLDPRRPATANAATMTEASRAIQTMQVTEAVRNATVSGRKVKKGQAIVLDPDDGLLAAHREPHRAVLAALPRLDPGFGLITVYYGQDASLADAEALALQVRDAAPGVDVEVIHGGQPHYRYLISAE